LATDINVSDHTEQYALKISKLNEMDEISKVHATMIVEMVKEKIVHFA